MFLLKFLLEFLFNKVAGLQVFFYEYFNFVKSSIFYRTLTVAASANVVLHYIFKKTLLNIL